MAGRPFAGKSTLRRELVKRFGFSVASVDWEINNRGMDVANMTQDEWNLAYSETYEKLKNLLKENKTTILDLGNLKRSERDTARKIAKALGVTYKLIFVNTPLEEVRRRWLENMEKPEGRKMEESVFNRGQDMFEEPTLDENPIIYNSEMDLGKWINKNIE